MKPRLPLWFIIFVLPAFLSPATCWAQSRQDEVFRGINDNVGQEVDPNKLIAVLVAIVAVAMLVAVVNYSRKRNVNPKELNSPGKLTREIARVIGLKPTEVRHLKSLAEQQQLISPLTLLICPSVMSRAVKDNPGTIDRRLLASLARKAIDKG
ncbi:MAG TPA: hypothetical protein VHD56_00070 [Tepidisphaeraceae bacterium]|nr:hypothetical protein [Tepidisphaeraceae bacterium]